MKHIRMHVIPSILAIITLACTSCGPYLKDSREIKTNGFITDNCYQALLEIEPDDSARGLVARRESAYLKAKNVDVKDMALLNLAAYCENQLRGESGNKFKKDAGNPEIRNEFHKKLKSYIMTGSISFVYYNERGSMIIGYRLFKVGFRKKVAEIIHPPVDQNAAPTTPGAKL